MSPLSARPITAFWRRLDVPGHDACRIAFTPEGVSLTGCAVFRERGRVCQLRYEVQADAAFHSRRARVAGFMGRNGVDLDIRVGRGQRWKLNGIEQPQLAGCIDVDLNFTPATNLLALRRLALRVGEEAQAPAAWLSFPSLELLLLPQSYRRISRTEYAYEAPTVGYGGILCVSPAGVVLHYPGLFEAEQAAR